MKFMDNNKTGKIRLNKDALSFHLGYLGYLYLAGG